MNAGEIPKRYALTGANGFVGGRIKSYLQTRGLAVVEWSRQPRSSEHAVRFQLGQEVNAHDFDATAGLIHCAYDFSVRNWDDIVAVNVRGSENLLRAAKAAGVERLVFISSLSAFEGCRSLYGRAKLEMEKIALSLGALVIRPGLVYGDQPGGVFGGLVTQARRARFIPLIGGGTQPQYLVHADDLAALIARYLNGDIEAPRQPVTLAHERPWPMRDLMTQLGEALGRKVRFVSVPWRLVWLGLKSLETVGLPAPFRSDSLIGYVYQNSKPDFTVAASLRASCRPFQINRDMLG